MRQLSRELTPSPSAFRVSGLPCSMANVVGTAVLHIVLQFSREAPRWRQFSASSRVSSSCAVEAHSTVAPMTYAVAVGLDDDFRLGACCLPVPMAGNLQRCVLSVPLVSSPIPEPPLGSTSLVHSDCAALVPSAMRPPSSHYRVPLAASDPPAAAVRARWPVSSHIPELPPWSTSSAVSSHMFPELLGASTSTPSGAPCLSHRVRAYSSRLLRVTIDSWLVSLFIHLPRSVNDSRVCAVTSESLRTHRKSLGRSLAGAPLLPRCARESSVALLSSIIGVIWKRERTRSHKPRR